MGLLDDAIRDHLDLKRRHGADPGDVARLEHEALGPARREPVDPPAAPAPEPDAATGAVAMGETADEPSADLFDQAPPARYGEPVHDEPGGQEPVQHEPIHGEPPPAAEGEPALRAAPVLEEEPHDEPALRAAPALEEEPHDEPALGAEPEPDSLPSSRDHEKTALHDDPSDGGGDEEDFGAVSMGDVPEGTDQPTVQFSPDELEEAGRGREPDAGTLEPEAGTQEPGAVAQEPGAVAQEADDEAQAPDDGAQAQGTVAQDADDGAQAEDVLEETPEFLQETPEHDRLWFEQKPPRDFEF